MLIMKYLYILSVIVLLAPQSCKLYFVASVVYNGARNHINALFDGNTTLAEWGQLTPVGMRQQSVLGALSLIVGNYIDRDYGKVLFSSLYLKNQSIIYTTTHNRSIQSAQSLLYGVFGLGKGSILLRVAKQLHLPPYSYKDDVPEQDYALPSGTSVILLQNTLISECSNYNAEVDKSIQAQAVEYKEMTLTYTPFLNKLKSVFNMQSMSFANASALYDTLLVDLQLGRSIPLQTADIDNLRHLHNWYTHFTLQGTLAKMFNTFKFNTILSKMGDAIKNSTSTKFMHFAAEEDDLVAFRLGLNISTAECIEDYYRNNRTTALNCDTTFSFSSSVFVQLHSDDARQYYVKIRSNGKYIYPCVANTLTCKYTEWSQKVKVGVLPNAETVCGKHQ